MAAGMGYLEQLSLMNSILTGWFPRLFDVCTPPTDMHFDQLGPYKIGRKLGRGGMGTVYEGIDAASG
jgi:hypothetical protein